MKLLLALIILQTVYGVNIPGDLTAYPDSSKSGSFAASDWTTGVYRYEGSSLDIQATFPPSIYIYISSEPTASDALGEYRVGCYSNQCQGPGSPPYTRSGNDYSVSLTFHTESLALLRPDDNSMEKHRTIYLTVKLNNEFYNIAWTNNSPPPNLYLDTGTLVTTTYVEPLNEPDNPNYASGSLHSGLSYGECQEYAAANLVVFMEESGFPRGCSSSKTYYVMTDDSVVQRVIWSSTTKVNYGCNPNAEGGGVHCLRKSDASPSAVDCNTHKNDYQQSNCCQDDTQGDCAALKAAYDACKACTP